MQNKISLHLMLYFFLLFIYLFVNYLSPCTERPSTPPVTHRQQTMCNGGVTPDPFQGPFLTEAEVDAIAGTTWQHV